MATYANIETHIDHQIGTLWLNRPDVRNAFNERMIAEIILGVKELEQSDHVRLIIIRGRGKSFCAGADLNWMKDVASYSYQQNLKESQQLANCFKTVYDCSKPVIAVVHGAAMGGANGLLAACDIVIATNETVFSLSEVKLGLIPACISPYVIKRVGEFPARDLMITGRRILGPEAEQKGLINKSLAEAEVEAYLQSTIDQIMTSGPASIGACKQLISDVGNSWSMEQSVEKTAEKIAFIRSTPEAQEGMAAFLEKRIPSWVNKSQTP